MAGWSKAVGPLPKNAKVGRDDGLPAAALVPAIGQAAWWRDFAFFVQQEFARQAQLHSPNVQNIAFSAGNGAGDVNGIGTLTISITTT